MTRKSLSIVVDLWLAATVILLLSLKHDRLPVFPFTKSSTSEVRTSHEAVEKGFSKSSYTFEKNTVVFKYTLSKVLQEPITALYFFNPTASTKYFDFSGFNEVSIDLQSEKGKRIPIYLTIDYKKLKTVQPEFLSMPLVQVIDYTGAGEYKLNKADFEIPSWWLRYHGLKREDIGDIDFSKVDYILINSCQVLRPEIEDTITIRSIAFTHNNRLKYYIYFSTVTVLLLIFSLTVFIKKRKKILVPYKMNDINSNPNGTKIERILHYIGENYTNPNLTVADIQTALGITTREIGNLIKDELNTFFKAYLNTIRLTEIKRLLLETDLPISDIAYKTGYNNISHFNRVFKTAFDVSPKEFREMNGK